MTYRQQVRALSRSIADRKRRLRAYGLSQPRLSGILRLQISQLQSRRYGLTRTAAAMGQSWAVSYLRLLRRMAMLPQYSPIGLPTTSYNPWFQTYPQSQYSTLSYYNPYRPTRPATAGYHPYIPGQKGAQVPSHLSRFGIGAMSPDDVEGVVEPMGLDGFGELRIPKFFDYKNSPIGSALVAGGALVAISASISRAFGKRTKKKKDAHAAGLFAMLAGMLLNAHARGKNKAASLGDYDYPPPGGGTTIKWLKPIQGDPVTPVDAEILSTYVKPAPRFGLKTMINGY